MRHRPVNLKNVYHNNIVTATSMTSEAVIFSLVLGGSLCTKVATLGKG